MTEETHMADLYPSPDTSDDTGVGSDGGPAPSTPRWVKVFGIIALVVVLLVAIMLISGHGPGRHMHGAMHGAGLGGDTPPSSVTERGVR
jgi:hypothetical protein